MDKPADLEKPIEMEIVNAPLEEKEVLDTKDGAEESKEAKAHVAFVENMEKRIAQLFHWLKFLIFFVAAILFLLFLFYDIFASSEKKVPNEVMTKLSNIMKTQGVGSFSPILDVQTNSSLLQNSNQSGKHFNLCHVT